MFEEILGSGWLAYIGLALLPTPPSPVPDFGVQFLLSLVFGVSAPQIVVVPFSKAVIFLGRKGKQVFGGVSKLSSVVDKVDELYGRWIDWLSKDRESENRVVNRLYEALGREDFIARIIFGYFCTSLIGLFLIFLSILTGLG